LTVVWLFAAALLVFPAISAHAHGRALSSSFWFGVVALAVLAWNIVNVWRRLTTRYPKL
jgi:hypothetical protein